MTNFVYNEAAYRLADQNLNLETLTLKLMLVNDSYVADRDDQFVDEGGTHDAVDAEITAVTNYVRKELTSGKAWAKDTTNDMAWFDAEDPTTWTSLGGASNDTIEAVILIYDTGVDTTSLLIAYYDTTSGSPSLPYTTTGGNFSVNINAQGLINLKTNP